VGDGGNGSDEEEKFCTEQTANSHMPPLPPHRVMVATNDVKFGFSWSRNSVKL